MPRVALADALPRMIQKLKAEKAAAQARADKFLAKVAKVDQILLAAGINPESLTAQGRRGRKPGRKPATAKRGPKPGSKRSRGVFPETGDVFILNFIKKSGTPSTAEVNEAWIASGRKGKADNMLTRLVKDKKLKRVKSEDVRGSRYALA